MKNAAVFCAAVFCLAALTAVAAPHPARADQAETARINRLLDAAAPEDFILVYRDVPGLDGLFKWHIKGTPWWVSLHPADIYPVDSLKQDTEYGLSGIVLDQAYGSVNIWVVKLRPLK